MKHFHNIASLSSIISGLTGTVYYWQTNSVLAYVSILLLGVGIVWIATWNRRFPELTANKSLDQIIAELRSYSEGESAKNTANAILAEQFEEPRKANQPELIGAEKLLIKEPVGITQKLGNLLYNITQRWKLTKFLFVQVFLKTIVGMTVSLRTKLSAQPWVLLLCWVPALYGFCHIIHSAALRNCSQKRWRTML